MRAVIDPTGTFHLESERVTLRHAFPVVNGTVIENFTVETVLGDPVEGDGSRMALRYSAPALAPMAFTVQIHCSGERCSWLRYSLENAQPEAVRSFGLRFGQVENLRAYLANGYHSWDGTFYVDVEGLSALGPDEQRPETGYAMTQLLPRFGSAAERGGSVVLGFDRHERFQHEFHFNTRETPPALTVLTDWDNVQSDPDQPGVLASDRLLLLESEGVEDGLREWARLVAEEAQVAPRLSGPPITGWCSWYNLYAYINENVILEYLRATREVVALDRLPMGVFQIDDGFTPEMGDWLEVKPQFPRGMKPLLDDIRAAGFTPGLWIAPFLVGNRSRLFCEHPDWVYHERSSGNPLPMMKMYGEFRWHKRSEEYYCLDATHPEAFEYLRRVFHTWRQEWGCEYFKTDFMLYGANYGPDEVVYHTPGLTRIEIWRRVAEMMREEIGGATWLGCGCPLWASIGLVDAVRIGGDVGVNWSEGLSAQSLLRDQTTRSFANQILWQIDPDCVLLRERFHHLSDTEVRSLAIFAGMSGGVMMTSDKLDELSPERLRLWKLILPRERTSCEHPFLGRTSLSYIPVPDLHHPRQVLHDPQPEDPALVQVRRGADLDAVFVLNTGSRPLQRTYTLVELGLETPLHVFDWTVGQSWEQPVDRLNLTLAPHDGALFFLSPAPIMSPPESLP